MLNMKSSYTLDKNLSLQNEWILGADWFYLSAGSAGYIVAGVFKLLTCGGLGKLIKL